MLNQIFDKFNNSVLNKSKLLFEFVIVRREVTWCLLPLPLIKYTI